MKKIKKAFSMLIIGLMILGSSLLPAEITNAEDGYKIKSGNIWIGEGINTELILDDIDKLGLNTMNIPIQVDVPSTTSTNMTINQNQKNEAIALIEVLNQNNINIILQPYVYIQNGSVGETEWNPTDKMQWFQRWEERVVNPLLDEIANPYNVWAFNVSTNPKHMESYENEWSNMLQRIKGKYSGNVIFRTNWWYTSNTYNPDGKAEFLEKVNRSYWEHVDFISIDAWFEITEKQVPTVEEIKAAMIKTDVYNRQQNVLEEIEFFHTQTGKDIFFGGFGFPAREYGLKFPWNVSVSNVHSAEVQKNGFQAYRDVLEDKPWFKGFSVWAIGIESSSNYSYKIEDDTVPVIYGWYENQSTPPTEPEEPICDIEEPICDCDIEDLENQIAALRESNEELTNENNVLKDENLNLKEENTVLKAENIDLKEENSGLKSIIDAIKALLE